MTNFKDYNVQEGDLALHHKGEQFCPPGHAFGPYILDHYLLHYVVEGEGIFKTSHGTYPVSKHQFFLITPNQLTFYQASVENPWHYIWTGFHGDQCARFIASCMLSEENPILHIPASHVKDIEAVLAHLLQVKNNKNEFELLGNGYLRILLHYLKDSNKIQLPKYNSDSNDYIQSAIQYIHRNYGSTVEVQNIAAYIGLDRSYFSKLFKLHTHMSPQEYLDFVRIEHAKDFLRYSVMSVSSIAYSVGFGDALYFSRKFKQKTGTPPLAYRKASATN